ncbi:phosphomethylpyrimidine synthase ThiC [Thermosyntropha sp.]|uniref:phosphomethylpyrimidine synthase ThiC n=1 Tax=Thermosyntropha sp. TaxID=2740820 RepID=UPI0025DD530A|nr:phosphomethylpyrimidine synthase ThiC [Thermosyntropha sp.]MBO8158293.1 phosphomethylpyrimidine synthase ThiC [Thermosyntropha sp.]
MTQLIRARKGEITPEMKKVSEMEDLPPEEIREGVAEGFIVIPANLKHKDLKVCGIGKGLKTKVNANLGVSKEASCVEEEMKKLETALKSGADTVMDLSLGPVRDDIRRRFIELAGVPVGTVPIYHASAEAEEKYGDILAMTEEDMFRALETHIEDGVDFVTVHCGINRESLACLDKNPRLMGIVSRGGAITAAWMKKHSKENPFYEYFEDILKLCARYDTVLSLGDGMRPGAVIDANDPSQIEETIILGELVKKAREYGVQVMVEGPGHMTLDRIKACVDLQKTLCHDAPFYILGPLVTDIAPGYDHIGAAIGGAWAAFYGADFLCCVTPAEHLGLPDKEDMREGVIAARLAAHAADIAKGKKELIKRDIEISKARKNLDWEGQIKLSLDPEKADVLYRRKNHETCSGEACSMCGDYCAVRLNREL